MPVILEYFSRRVLVKHIDNVVTKLIDTFFIFCSYTAQEDQLEVVDKRIAIFKSICNPAFISLTSKDPILTSLRLFKDLKNWSKSDSASAKEYNIIGDNVARFSSELMGENVKSLKIIL